MSQGASQGKRLLRAVLVVALGLACIALSGGVAKAVSAARVVQEVSSEASDEGSAEVPQGFEQEVFSMANMQKVRAAQDGSVVGFSLPEAAESAFLRVRSWLEENGWTYASSGMDTCGTFTKSSGAYQWLFVSCTYVDGQTSVVVECAQRS